MPNDCIDITAGDRLSRLGVRRCRAPRLKRTEGSKIAIDGRLLQCPCGARRRVLSLACDPAQIARVLEHMGLPTDPPERAPPRAVQGVMQFGEG